MADNFEAYAVPAAPAVNALDVHLFVSVGDSGNEYQALYKFDVVDENGVVLKTRDGNLLPHLTPTQVTATKNLVDALLVKAQSTVPEEPVL